MLDYEGQEHWLPEISDEAYDRLFDALKRLEQRFPDLTTPDSPTQRVGAKPREHFRVAEHTAPMLSLDATREEDEVRRFVERIRKSLNGAARYLLEEKFDGASVELVYKDGILNRAITRGDGPHRACCPPLFGSAVCPTSQTLLPDKPASRLP